MVKIEQTAPDIDLVDWQADELYPLDMIAQTCKQCIWFNVKHGYIII